MRNVQVTLPDPLVAWIEHQVAAGRCGDLDQYFAELIRADQLFQEARQRLVMELDKGEASGVSSATVEDIFERVKARRGVAG
jgi:antitoxin ParD1/3/4